jgi:hypothetical protein
MDARRCPPARSAAYEDVPSRPFNGARLLQHCEEDSALVRVESSQLGNFGVHELDVESPLKDESQPRQRMDQTWYLWR